MSGSLPARESSLTFQPTICWKFSLQPLKNICFPTPYKLQIIHLDNEKTLLIVLIFFFFFEVFVFE